MSREQRVNQIYVLIDLLISVRKINTLTNLLASRGKENIKINLLASVRKIDAKQVRKLKNIILDIECELRANS